MMLIQYIKNARKSLKKVRETKTNDTKIYIHFYNECNFGDDAFVAMLANRYPNVTFFISGKREYLKAFEKVKNIVSYNDTNLKLFANKIIRKLTKKDPLFGCRAYRCQSCITIGGSIFIEPQSVDLSAYFRNKINKLFSGKNNLIIGANFGPYQNDSFLQFFRNEFHRYNYISVRDLDSYSLFQDIDNVNYAPDILFGIRNIVHSITVPVNARPYIVISVINKVDDLESYKHKLKEIVCYNHDLHFDVVMLSLCELQGDLSLCNEIVSGVDFDVKIHSYNGSNMQEVIHCIQSASYVIGSRFHAIITALAFQVPCFPIVYSNKTVNMLKDIGYSGRYGLIDELANLSMQEIDENRRKKYTPDVERLVKESEKHFLFLDKIGI
jgi:colanic acid/amylovoran biosynthesis protein